MTVADVVSKIDNLEVTLHGHVMESLRYPLDGEPDEQCREQARMADEVRNQITALWSLKVVA